MSNELFVKIISAIITIIVSLITAFVIPAIKSHINEKDMETIMKYARIAIMAADQLYTKEQWQEKKQYVYEYICAVVNDKLHVKLTPEDIDTIIEGLVNEIHENGVR